MRAFLDTNILVYAQQEGGKADAARRLIADGGTISVQVLNELTNVLRKKFGRSWPDVEAVIEDVALALGEASPVTALTHAAALRIARDHGLGIYDALIVASALAQDCSVLYSEDMQDGRVFGGLTIRNPFANV